MATQKTRAPFNHTPRLPSWRRWRVVMHRRFPSVPSRTQVIHEPAQATATRSRSRHHQRLLPLVFLLLGGAFLLMHVSSAPPVTHTNTQAAATAPSTAAEIGLGGAQNASTASKTARQKTTSHLIVVSVPTPVATPAAEPPPVDTKNAPSAFGVNLGDVVNGMIHWLLQQVASFLQWLMDWFTDYGFLYTTPAGLTYKNASVIALHTWILAINASMIGLILIIGGYKHVFAERSDAFREWLPRLCFAGAIAVVSLPFMGHIIELQNTATVSIQGALASAGVGNVTLQLWNTINLLNAPIYEMIVYILELLGLLLVAGQMLARLALLDLLIVLAPLGLILFPRVWFQFFVYTLFTQFLQVLCIALGSAIVAGVGHSDTSPISWFVGLASIALACKIPGMIMYQLRAGLGDPKNEILNDVADSAVQLASIALA